MHISIVEEFTEESPKLEAQSLLQLVISASVEEELQPDLQAKWFSGQWLDMHKKHELSPVVQLKIEDWGKQGGLQAIQRKLQIQRKRSLEVSLSSKPISNTHIRKPFETYKSHMKPM